MRPLLHRLHRWLGLFTAAFLFLAGSTGAVLCWNEEIDAWLNPELYRSASGQGPPLSPLALADRLEAGEPGLQITFLPLDPAPGAALLVTVGPRADPATGEARELGFDQVALDPSTGAIQGRRLWGRISLARADLVSFLYELHYSLHLPEVGGYEPGVLWMGLVATAWVIDCFVSLWIAFPSLGSWRRSLTFRVREGGVKLLFDLHRSGGVWIWGLSLVFAVSAVSLNLHAEVMQPLVSLISPLTPDPFADRPERSGSPALTRAEALEIARAEGLRRGWEAPAGALSYDPDVGLYGVGFFAPGGEDGDGGLGNPWLYVDDRSGEIAGAWAPGAGTAGDLFLDAQFPLHSGRILGTPGRILVTFAGIGISGLSATGVILWARRQLRAQRTRIQNASPSMSRSSVAAPSASSS